MKRGENDSREREERSKGQTRREERVRRKNCPERHRRRYLERSQGKRDTPKKRERTKMKGRVISKVPINYWWYRAAAAHFLLATHLFGRNESNLRKGNRCERNLTEMIAWEGVSRIHVQMTQN